MKEKNIFNNIGQADKVVITTIIDNYIDVFLPSSDNIRRWGPPHLKEGVKISDCDSSPLMAEHGFSLLIEVFYGSDRKVILFDTGFGEEVLLHNLDKMSITINDIDMVIISHAHPDHSGGLLGLLRKANRKIPVVIHPNGFVDRYLIFPNKDPILGNTMDKAQLEELEAELVISEDILNVCPGVMVTSEVEMTNDFEDHFQAAYYKDNDVMKKDYFCDEKSLIINLKNKGLIILSGCGHRGIINTVDYAKRVTGIDEIYGVIGGFHLTGVTQNEKIERTIYEMKKYNPEFIIPTHCTGWKAMERFSTEMPQSFILNSVGTRFSFNS